MAALELLRTVSDAYKRVNTLAIEAVKLTESGDENQSQRSEHRVRFSYAAPNRLRYEPCGKNGMVQVADGTHLHTTVGGHGFGRHRRGPRFSSIPLSESHPQPLPHLFRADFPLSNQETFLFQGIEERVAAARILRQEDGCYVLAVTYEPPWHQGVLTRGDILFWVDANTNLVMKYQYDLGHRFPLEDEVRWSRLTMSVQKLRLNEPLPEDTFVFTPPAGASEMSGRHQVSVAGAGGFIQHGPDASRRLEHRGSHEWEGETLVEHSTWKIRGMVFDFERRLTFSDDEKELHITERITGPQGEAEGNFDLRLS